MSLFSRLFPGETTRKAIAGVEIVLDELRRKISEDFATNLLEKRIKDNIFRAKSQVEDALVNNNEPPLTFAWKVVFLTSQREVTSGQYHSYRGVLTFDGMAFERIWLISGAKLVELNFLKAEAFERLKGEMKEAIENVG
jgi:hypothetical protein